MKTKYNLSSVFGRLLLLACLLAVSREAMADNYTYNADNTRLTRLVTMR